MSNIRVAPNGCYFEKDGAQFFLMADTCWSAFTNMGLDEFERYLQQRSSQGFNAIFLNILPQWDRGLAPGERVCPFVQPGQKELRFSDIPADYFKHICAYLELMQRYGMTPVLVLLWSNYVKGTFFDKLWGSIPMQKEDVDPYVRCAASYFRNYDPMYFVCGDSDFSQQAVDDYYLPALKALKGSDPKALASLHCCGEGFLTAEEIENSIPEQLLYSDLLDFYSYQSGHLEPWLERCTQCAKAFRSLKKRKPVINAEPCYEGWDTDSTTHGRDHMRQSTWLSILSGADAGLGYGAQGVWPWFREGDFFAPSKLKEKPLLYTCEQPFTAWQAMSFDGVQDRVFARKVIEHYGIYDIEPDNRFEAEAALTRLALCKGRASLLLYMPRNQLTCVHVPVDGLRFDLYDLKRQKKISNQVILDKEGFSVNYPGVNSDTLLVGYPVDTN